MEVKDTLSEISGDLGIFYVVALASVEFALIPAWDLQP
jgi:hypothetical protein